ncbi:hypothetical protein [Cohnella soli]|uniref:Lipoprotein LpqB beta-propeller domain-containing protein n=1 Tax=Cohnella soli TaxID=425005 RepID=A0ABW0I330_9BACL
MKRMKTTLRRIVRPLLALTLLLLLLILSSCRQMQMPMTGSDREEVESTSGKRITVLDNPEPAAYGKSTSDAIVRLDGVRGMDWLSEDKILVGHPNRDFEPEQAEGMDWYPDNLYVLSLADKSESPLLPKNENQGFAQVSPDRMKVFYKTYSLQANTGMGHLYDFSTGKSVSFTEPDAMDIQNGRWVDNDTVAYATIDGSIWLAHTGSATPRKLLDTGIPFVTNIDYLNNRLYYSSLKGAMITATLDGQKPALLTTDRVVWMVPSPDEKRLAVVRRLKSGSMELNVTDLQGNVIQAIAQDAQIFGVAWSPDGSKLAYAGIAPNGTVRSIYVADPSTGLSAPLSLDAKFMDGLLRWSPTGNRIMVSTSQLDEQQRNRSVTFLVRASNTESTERSDSTEGADSVERVGK